MTKYVWVLYLCNQTLTLIVVFHLYEISLYYIPLSEGKTNKKKYIGVLEREE